MSEQRTLTIEQALNLAVQHHSAGRLAKAENIYQQILHTSPNQIDALNLLGDIAYQVGKNDIALDLVTKAISIKPDFAEAHNNLGNIFQALGRSDESGASYLRALKITPDYADALYNSGTHHLSVGELVDGRDKLVRAVTLKPDFPYAHNNLGNVLKDLSEFDLAESHLRRALELKPDYIDALNTLGQVLENLGREDEAEASYRQALDIDPNHATSHYLLANLLLVTAGNDIAFPHFRHAVSTDPNNRNYWIQFADCLAGIKFTTADERLYQDLMLLLDQPNINAAVVAPPIISAIWHHPSLTFALASVEEDGDESSFKAVQIAAKLSEIPLFLRTIAITSIHDLALEKLLTKIRRRLLLSDQLNETCGDVDPFLISLALHCFANEYLFSFTVAEHKAWQQLQDDIEYKLEHHQEVLPHNLVILGCYLPLYQLSQATKLLNLDWSNEMLQLISRQVSDPLEEKKLRAQIPRIGNINNKVSRDVRSQYEESPYPRWIKPAVHPEANTIPDVLRSLGIALDQEPVQEKPLDVLVAGCGTGQHALLAATRYTRAKITAIDLSLNSLAYAMRKTQELEIDNIDYAHADILDVAALGQQFDLVESAGVLHHMEDPVMGWRKLVSVVRPGGFLLIGLYSKIARRSVVAAQQRIFERGYTNSPADIRNFRSELIETELGTGSELGKILDYKDFYSISECRDLLFHVQEHHFTLQEIAAILKQLGLTFLGFELYDTKIKHMFQSEFRKKHACRDLKTWHKFEQANPDTFRSMYQFWCRKGIG